jgi:hypothetical protein
MRVSVIVPLYNKANYIMRALDSIVAQTFSDFEVIVIDDGSSDGGGEIAATYPDSRIRVLRQANAGPGAARNRAIAEAMGEFIAFLDADDAWMPEYLRSSVGTLDELGLDVATVTSGYIEFPKGISCETMWRNRGITDGVCQVTASTGPLRLHNMLVYMTPCSTLVRAEAVRRYSGFYSKNHCKFGEDAVLWLKVLLNEVVCFRTRPLACLHREASELSGNYKGARPIEPFLTDPDEVTAACRHELLPLLWQFYALRACKTVTMLGCWGEWKLAQTVFKRFVRMSDWQLPFFVPALISCTPVAGIVGRALIAIRSATKG